MRISHWVLVVGGLALVSCGRDGERTERRDTSGMMGHMDSGGMGEMNMRGTQMMSQMRSHMDSMARMPPQQMQAMMASHQAMMSQMMDRMGSEMREMNMAADARWTALTDSVKRDLADLPSLKGQELQARMRTHQGRVQRLIEMHKTMMKGM